MWIFQVRPHALHALGSGLLGIDEYAHQKPSQVSNATIMSDPITVLKSYLEHK